MFMTVLQYVFLTFISLPGFSGTTTFSKKDLLVIPENNAGEVLETKAEGIFEFLNLKDLYCGHGPHVITFRALKTLPRNTFEFGILYPNGKIAYRNSGISAKADSIYSIKLEFNTVVNQLYSYGTDLRFLLVSDDNKYQSLSRPIEIPMSHITAESKSHCEGFSSRINFTGNYPYEELTWYFDSYTRPVGHGSSFEAREAGLYYAETVYKGCTTLTKSQRIDVGKVPNVSLRYDLNNSICNDNPVPLMIIPSTDVDPLDGNKLFSFTEYHWILDGKLIEKTRDDFFLARKPGVYNVIPFQGSCYGQSDSLKISRNTSISVAIEDVQNDKVIHKDNVLYTCAGNSVELRQKFVDRSWFDVSRLVVYPPGDKIKNKSYPDSFAKSGNIYFQWKRNGVDIPGGNSRTIVVNQSGTYILQIRQGSCIANSNAIQVNYTEKIQLDSPQRYYHPLKDPRTYTSCEGLSPAMVLYPYLLLRNFKTTVFFNNVDITGEQPSLFRYYQPGTYQAKYRLYDNCYVYSDTITVNFKNNTQVLPVEKVYSCTNEWMLLTWHNAPGISKIVWRKDGVALPFTTSDVIVYEPGFYTAEIDWNDCKYTYQFQTEVNKIAANLNINQLSEEGCNGGVVKLKGIYTEENQYYLGIGLVNFKLFLNDSLIEERRGTRDEPDYLIGNWGVQFADFQVDKPGEYSIKIDIPDCETISNKVELNFKEVNSEIIPEIVQYPQCVNTLKISEVNGDRYEWYKNNEPLNINSPEIRINEAGSYFAKIERGNCVTFTNKMNVYPDSPLLTGTIWGDTLVDIGDTANLRMTFTGTPPFSYKLNNNEEGTASSFDHIHPVKINSNSVFSFSSVKNVCGEGETLGEVKIRINLLGKEPVMGKYIRIFPVPASTDIGIEFERLESIDVSFELFNVSGKSIVKETRLIRNGQKLDLNHLPAGEYFIRIKAGKDIIVRKIVKW